MYSQVSHAMLSETNWPRRKIETTTEFIHHLYKHIRKPVVHEEKEADLICIRYKEICNLMAS